MQRCTSRRPSRPLAWTLGVTMALATIGCGDDDATPNGGPGDGGPQDGWTGDGGAGAVIFAITRVSVDSDGEEGIGSSWDPAITADGQRIAFVSGSAFVPDDTNVLEDVYLHDRSTGQTTRVSVGSDGGQAESGFTGSDDPAISADGRHVVFVTGQQFSHDVTARQIYLRDLQEGDTHLISIDNEGDPAEAGLSSPAVSDDGRFVAYTSNWDMVAGEAHDDMLEQHIFVHDRQGPSTIRASVNDGGDMGEAPNALWKASFHPAISADGRYIAFDSNADNLVEGITNDSDDVFVHDRTAGQTTRVSVASDGSEGEGSSGQAAISADGRYVAFASGSNFIDGGTHLFARLYVHDRQEGTTERVGDLDHISDPSMSADGRYLAFVVNRGGVRVVHWHDRQTGASQRVSETAAGERPNDDSRAPAISADGRVVAFHSDASDLVPDDTNGQRDVFVAVMQ
jgi:Tol biopolymer transport system component